MEKQKNQNNRQLDTNHEARMTTSKASVKTITRKWQPLELNKKNSK